MKVEVQKVPRIGPRTRQRREAYRLRKAMLDSGRTKNVTVEAARAETVLSAADRAERDRGGNGQTPKLSSDAREENYILANGYPGVTARQERQLYRMSHRAGEGAIRDERVSAYVHAGEQVPGSWTTRSKGRATPKRPMTSAKGVQR